MKKLIIISDNFSNMFPEKIGDCDFQFLYTKKNKINRYLNKLIFVLHLPFYNFVFKGFYKTIQQYDEIILFDTGNLNYIYKILKKKFPEKRIIIWYWNNTRQSLNPAKLISYSAEIWSFDFNDIEKYQFKCNTTFYFEEKMIKRSDSNINQDLFYVGVDKDRAEILSSLMKEFDKQNLTYNINLVQYRDKLTNDYGIKYKTKLSYDEVIKNINSSKAIIDIVSYGQGGLTLRPIEALYYKKKLITNYKEITKYNFYNKNNIFIVGVDDLSNLKKFVNSNYDDTNWNELVKYYEFNSWLDRFEKRG